MINLLTMAVSDTIRSGRGPSSASDPIAASTERATTIMADSHAGILSHCDSPRDCLKHDGFLNHLWRHANCRTSIMLGYYRLLVEKLTRVELMPQARLAACGFNVVKAGLTERYATQTKETIWKFGE